MAEVAALLAQLRLDLEDPELPGDGDDADSLWSDAELLHYIDRAQVQFATEIDCLPDATSFTSKVTAGKYWVERDPLITRIRSGYLRTAGRDVFPTTLLELKRGYESDDYGYHELNKWRTVTGTPQFVVTDMDALQNRLVPIPAADDTIEWMVYRLPQNPVEDTSSELEIDERWHYELLVWAKYMAFGKQDAETQDSTRRQDAKNDWDNRVIPEARKYFRLKQRKAGTTSYGGIW